MKQAIISILIISLGFGVNAQSLKQTLDYARSSYEQENFVAAESAFRRVLFFDKAGVYASEINFKLANSLYFNGSYQEANYYYDLAYFLASDSLKTVITLQKASSYLLLQNYSYTRIELYNLPLGLSTKDQKQALFYEAMLEFAEQNFDTSEVLFKQLSTDTLVIDNLFVKNSAIEKLNPKTAKVLSIIVPGLGQMYAGDWKAGINSFVLTGGLFYLGIRSGINNSFLDAAISVLPWFQRYYTGGFKRAEKIAIAKKQERRYAVFNELLRVINEETLQAEGL